VARKMRVVTMMCVLPPRDTVDPNHGVGLHESRLNDFEGVAYSEAWRASDVCVNCTWTSMGGYSQSIEREITLDTPKSEF
jgi:hypothetical protein